MKTPTNDSDTFVPDKIVCAEFGVSTMALWRWTHDPELGFPQPIYICKRKYRSRQQLEEFKQKMMRKAIKSRTA